MGTVKFTKGITASIVMGREVGTDTVPLDGGRAGKVAVTDETGVTGNTG